MTDSLLKCALVFSSLIISATAAAECPRIVLKPQSENNQVRVYESFKLSNDCKVMEVFTCPGGALAVSESKSIGDSRIVGGRCFNKTDQAAIDKYIPRRETLSPVAAPATNAAQETNPASASENSDLRAKALAKGVPAVIFDRAMKNYLEQMRLGKTSRDCFLATDLTTPENGKTWKICGNPISITQEATYWGSGAGDTCQAHPYTNTRNSCARFFGDKPNYCLSAGGNYITGEVERQVGTERQFVNLIGLDKNENDNTKTRNVGIHQTSTENGKRDYVGFVDPKTYSQGCVTTPFRGKGNSDMTDYSSEGPQGGLALYVYPSKADIVKFRETGSAPYWNNTCKKEIGSPGWIGTAGTFAPSPNEVASEEFLKSMGATRVPSSTAQGNNDAVQ